jgi:hypothetical protein
MRENKLNELQGVSILTKEFFNKLIRRIECTKPLAGNGISLKEKENGLEISFGNSVTGASQIELDVCYNGAPAKLLVVGVLQQ